MDWIKRHPHILTAIAIATLLHAWMLRGIWVNVATHLMDANDYPLVSWMIIHQIQSILSGNIGAIFQGKIFFPSADTLWFSDLFLPQVVMGLPMYALTKSAVITTNWILALTLVLNTLTSALWWRRWFGGWWLTLAIVLTSVFPFFTYQLAHLQMLALWTVFGGLTLVTSQTKTLKQAVLIGLWLGITTLSSVYLSIFLMTMIGVVFVAQLVTKRKSWRSTLRYGLMVLIAIIACTGPIFGKYYLVQKENAAARAYHEYVTYAADPVDYLSAWSLRGVIQQIPVLSSLTPAYPAKHGVVGFGFFPLVLTMFGLVLLLWHIWKSRLSVFSEVFFALIGMMGFFFSLGPRLTFAGTYFGWYLPYALFLKLIPLFSPLRATNRWSLLVYIAAIFCIVYALKTVWDSRWKYRSTFVAVLVGLVLVTWVPTSIPTTPFGYDQRYTLIAQLCDPQKVLLEYPLSPNLPDRTAGDLVTYWSRLTHATLWHECQLINGYSGLFPPHFLTLETQLNEALTAGDFDTTRALMSARDVDIIKLNPRVTTATASATLIETFGDRMVYSDDAMIVFEL